MAPDNPVRFLKVNSTTYCSYRKEHLIGVAILILYHQVLTIKMRKDKQQMYSYCLIYLVYKFSCASVIIFFCFRIKKGRLWRDK